MRPERHTLRYEGAPHDDEGERITSGPGPYGVGVGGDGRAKCSCGWLSDPLPSATQRRRHHRAHKVRELRPSA